MLNIEETLCRLEELSDIKRETSDADKFYLRKLCDALNERYEPCSCPDYHHDLAMQLYIKLKRQTTHNSTIYMNKIKHIIATRFLCFEGNLGDKVLSKEYIDMGLRLMSNYLIPTLENQTNKNFELVVLVHQKLNLGVYKRKFLAMSEKLNIQVVRFNKFDEYVRAAAAEAENLIVTRIDYDDLVWNGAVEDVQKRIGIAPLYIYGYNRGFAWQEGKHDLMVFYQEYKKHGHMSIFQSCVINTGVQELVGIHPYKWNHTRPLEAIERGEINKQLVKFEPNYLKDAFVWVRHENTSSGLIFPGYVKYKAHLDKDEVKRVFGVAILD